jgi:ABC-type bacteriocin/lantibiotic exporter with double-glycine peptidase domain
MLRAIAERITALLCLCGLLFATGPPGVWVDVPFVKQEKDGCGAASIAMVMQYWLNQRGYLAGKNADPAQIQRALYSSQAHGIYASDLERYLQQQGFRTFAFRGEWEDLKQHLEKGRPLIAALKPAGGNVSLHYVVVTGLDWDRALVMINDPAERKLLKESRSSFEKQWNAAGNWTLLAVPQQVGH